MKKILAVLLACSMLFAFAACGGNNEETTTTAAPETTTEAPAADETTVPAADETTAPAADETTAAADETTTAVEETTADAAKAPETTEEIVAYFNEASNGIKANAKSVKREYSKISLNGTPVFPSVINGVLKLLGGAENFLNDQLSKNSKGAETYTGADIKAVYPVEGESYVSKLTAADVKSATCKVSEDGKTYTITVVTKADGKSDSIQHGEGHAPKAFNVVLPGVVNDNIPGVATSLVGLSTMNYPSSTCKVTVDVETGRVLTADYDLKWTINFDKVGVVIPFTTHDYFVISY